MFENSHVFPSLLSILLVFAPAGSPFPMDINNLAIRLFDQQSACVRLPATRDRPLALRGQSTQTFLWTKGWAEGLLYI